MQLVLLVYGLYELFCIVEPLQGVWSMFLAKLSEMSVALSEQAAELSRLRSLLSEVLTYGSGSGSTAADAAGGAGSRWAPLVEVQTWFCYIKAVSETVLHTIGLMLITSLYALVRLVLYSV